VRVEEFLERTDVFAAIPDLMVFGERDAFSWWG
jgi:hypothetical protein